MAVYEFPPQVLEQIETDIKTIEGILRSQRTGFEKWMTVRAIVHAWATRFSLYQGASPTSLKVLLGTSALRDAIVRLNSQTFDGLLTAAGEWPTPANSSGVAEISSLEEAIELLLFAATDLGAGRSGLNKKPYVAHQGLVQAIIDAAGPVEHKVGGAAATLANVFAILGESSCALITPYLSPELAACFHESALRMRQAADGTIDLRPCRLSGNDLDPDKLHVAVEFSKGERLGRAVVNIGGCPTEIPPQVNADDRVIFRTEKWQDRASGNWLNPEWQPSLRYAGAQNGFLPKLANWADAVILTGWQAAALDPGQEPPAEIRQLREDLVAELEAFKRAGKPVHVEYSGKTSHAEDFLCNLLQGRIWSLGIGDELEGVAAALGLENPSMDDVWSCYRTCLELAERIGLDRLYWHGHKVDIIVRRDRHDRSDEGRRQAEIDIRREVAADLIAKHVAIWWLYNQSPPDSLGPVLRSEGVQALIDFALEAAEEALPNAIDLERWAFALQQAQGGYFVGASAPDEGWSVAIVPVKWSDGSSKLITTSVGDISSGTAFIQSLAIELIME